MTHIRRVRAVFAAISLLLAGLGLALMLWPDIMANSICVLLGGITVLCGVVKLIGYFSNDLYQLAFQFDLAAGLFTVIVGLFLLLRPEDVLSLLPVVMGLFILVDSALRLQTSIDAKHFGMDKWWLILAVSLGGALLGITLLLRPFQNGRALIRLMGLTLMLDGGENLLTGLYTIKVPRRADPRPEK